MVWYGQCQAGQGGQLGLQTIQIPGRAGYIAFKMDFTSPLDCQLESGQSQSVRVKCGNNMCWTDVLLDFVWFEIDLNMFWSPFQKWKLKLGLRLAKAFPVQLN